MTDANGKASWLNDLKYYACSRDTVRSDVLWVMTEAGVPHSIYRPHSTRAASGAAIRRGGGTESDVLRNADLSSKVYEKPIVDHNGHEVAGALLPAARAVYDHAARRRQPPREAAADSDGATSTAIVAAASPAAITNQVARRPPGRAPSGMDWDYEAGEWASLTMPPPPPPPPAISASRPSTATRSGRCSAAPGSWWASSSKQADKDNNLSIVIVLAIEDR